MIAHTFSHANEAYLLSGQERRVETWVSLCGILEERLPVQLERYPLIVPFRSSLHMRILAGLIPHLIVLAIASLRRIVSAPRAAGGP